MDLFFFYMSPVQKWVRSHRSDRLWPLTQWRETNSVERNQWRANLEVLGVWPALPRPLTESWTLSTGCGLVSRGILSRLSQPRWFQASTRAVCSGPCSSNGCLVTLKEFLHELNESPFARRNRKLKVLSMQMTWFYCWEPGTGLITVRTERLRMNGSNPQMSLLADVLRHWVGFYSTTCELHSLVQSLRATLSFSAMCGTQQEVAFA